MNKCFLKALMLVFCGSCIASTGWGAPVIWNLNPSGLNAPVGSSSQDFTVSGFTITARGYDNSSGVGSAHGLFFKNAGSDEIGLGLVDTAHNELQVDTSGDPLQFIQLDLRSILLQGFTNGKIKVGSVQEGELFNLFGSNTLGTLGSKLNSTPYDSSKDGIFVSVPSFGSFQFVSVVAAAADVLPVKFKATCIPEPGTFSLMILGGAGLAGLLFGRRRMRSR
jgi:PEP-CTERM motif-containing protein